MKKLLLLVIVCMASVALLIGGAGGAWGADYCVDPDGGTGTHTDLNAALSAAELNAGNDTVRVVQGVYTGNFSYSSASGDRISIYGGYVPATTCTVRMLDPANTVLDAGGSGKVLSVSDSAGGDITVEGFTIQHGDTTGNGGGLYARSLVSSGGATAGIIILSYNIVTGNTADNYGGGVYAYSAGEGSEESGGPVTLANNTITGNTTSNQGGGVYARSYSHDSAAGAVTLTNNTVAGNTADYYGGVYAISNTSIGGTAGAVTLINNIVAGNTAGNDYGGVCTYSNASSGTSDTVTFFHNTVTGNSATGTAGGVYLQRMNNTVNCYNNIIWGNTATTGGDIYLAGTGGSLNGYNNDYNPAAMSGSWTAFNYNINVNPLFIDPDYGDYRLRSSSGCKDQGNDSPPAPGLPSTDFEGDVRWIDVHPDIGADEVSVLTTCVSTASGLQGALTAAQTSGKGDIIMVVEGIYTYNQSVNGNFAYESSEGHNITLLGGYTTVTCTSRTIDPGDSVLLGDGNARVLYLEHSSGGDITLDGFTIQSGVASGDGGGLYARSIATGVAGTVTITNNIIRGNSTTAGGGGVYARSYSDAGTAGTVILFNNTITGNNADTLGGGVFASSYSVNGTPGILTCTNNTVTGNTAGTDGGGAYLYANSSNLPGGIVNCYNNIIWGNTAATGPDVYLSKATNSFAYAYNNDFTTPAGDSWDQMVNIFTLDPLFVGGGDYHLRPTSPCIDTGTNAAPSLPPYDFKGDDRIINSTVDRGADEFVPVYVILHTDGALWSTDTGWTLTGPPYYAGSAYARDLELFVDGDYIILHKDGALYDTGGVGWTMTTPPYYAGSNYAVDMEITATYADCILHRDGALWYSDTGWVMTSPPYYAGSDYARALELRADTSYVILHQYGGLYDSASGWVLTSPPYYAGSAWVVDMKLETGGYVLLHQDGALWSTSGGWVLTSPPYYAGSDYARDLELFYDGDYIILHKDGALYDSVNSWNMASPPYYPGSSYAVDLEVQ